MKTKTILVTLLALALLVAPAAATETIPGTVATEIQKTSVKLSVDEDTSLEPIVTETGKISLSVDGLGVVTGGSGVIQVEKPAGATVKSAYMAATDVWGSGQIPDGAITIDGQGVNWDLVVKKHTHNQWADVTDLVKPKIDAAPAGRIDFTIQENVYADGEILVVIFDDPSASVNTIVLMFGAQATEGDTFQVLLADPIDKSNASRDLEMGLGISFGYQSGYTGQYSIIDVNGNRLTSAAGGEDDGYSGDGGLLTVGGLDDSTENPANPNLQPSYPRYDDELYNIEGLVNDGDTAITVFTRNPSNDDNIFFAYFNLKSTVAVVGEGIVLGPSSATNPVGTYHTVTATVQDDDGNPVESKEVTFEVISGPHLGISTTAFTNSDGEATLTYRGTSEGTDTIVASFVDSQLETVYSNKVTKTWEAVSEEPIQDEPSESIPEFPTMALPIAAVLGLAFVSMRRK